MKHNFAFYRWRYDDPRYLDALLHLRTLREEGLIRHLGVTNFDTPHLRILLTSGIPIICNQVNICILSRYIYYLRIIKILSCCWMFMSKYAYTI